MNSVKLWEEMITLPTLSLGPHNPNPKFETYQSYRPYPYPYSYQSADRIKSDKEYLALHMENNFLKITVLPHFGSRLYSIYDKVNQKELLHSPKQVNIAFLPPTAGGTFAGIGMELALLDSHAMTNVLKREYSVVEHDDGSKSIVVGELDLRYRMRWAIHFTLKPGEACLHHRVQIQNQSETYGRFRYWALAGVSIDERDIEIIFPERLGWEHGGEFQGVGWPIHDGVDMRFPNRLPQTVGVEARGVRNGFFAYYDHTNNHGMVHWADPGDIKGKKMWTWGKSAHTGHRGKYFSDGKPFMEIDSGRDEDQEVFEVLEPFTTIQWDEVWYPVGAIGSVTNAGKTLAMKLLSDLSIASDKIELNLQSTLAYDRLSVEVASAQTVIGSTTINITPGSVKKIDLDLSKKVGIEDAVSIRFAYNNIILLHHTVGKDVFEDKYVDIISDVSVPEIDRTPDYLMNLARTKLRRFPQPKFCPVDDLLDEVLQKDPGHAEALRLKGMFLYEQGLFDEAIELLQKSLKRNFCDGETHYYLGLGCYRKQLWEDAYFAFSDAVKFNKQAMGYFYLGLLAVKFNDYEKALRMFGNAIDFNANHTRARMYYALVLHKLGRIDDALVQVDQASFRSPSDPLIALTKMLIETGTLKGFNATEAGECITTQLHGDIQTYYELVWNLAEIGLYREVLDFLDEIALVCIDSDGVGMLSYYDYYFSCKIGDQENASKRLSGIEDESIVYTFPFRHEELELLAYVLNDHPDDKFANYYIGLIKAGLTRYEEGYEHIKKAVDLGLSHPVAYNVLGEIAQKTLNDIDLAIGYFEKSLSLDDNNVFTLNFLADAYSEKKAIEKLDQLFENPLSTTNPDLVQKRINHLSLKDELDTAIDVLENKVNFPNMAQQLYPLYSETCIRRGIKQLRLNKYEDARGDFERALELRDNFGAKVWMKKYNIRAEYFLGLAHKKMGDDAKSEEIWLAAIDKQEQFQDWTISGMWNYGFWVDRYYQGWMLKHLGRTAEAVTYFDGIRAFAAHKFNSQISSRGRKDLLEMAYNGLNDDEINTVEVDVSYLSKE
jgi:tetratricopeptide (TPR) repeat protein